MGVLLPLLGAAGEGQPEAASSSRRAAGARRGFRAMSLMKLKRRSGWEEDSASWRERRAARSKRREVGESGSSTRR